MTDRSSLVLKMPIPVQITKLAAAVLTRLEEEQRPVTTPYALFQIMREIFRTGDRKKLFLREETATMNGLRRLVWNLQESRAIGPDPDYWRGVYRVMTMGEGPAEEVCALVNPFGYISHLSAMRQWGLTDRRPKALHLTMPPASAAALLIQEKMTADHDAAFFRPPPDQTVRLHFMRPPAIVRGRDITVHESKTPGQWLQIRDSHARLATIGQTFIDTLDQSRHCGGMAHVRDVWREFASTYREEIIVAVDDAASPIVKVRAGYLLDEMLRTGDDPRIQAWTRFAARGGSRVLDSSRPFSFDHSPKWMLSINV